MAVVPTISSNLEMKSAICNSSSEVLIKSGVEQRGRVGDAVKSIELQLIHSSGVSDVKSTTLTCTWLPTSPHTWLTASIPLIVTAVALDCFENGTLQLNKVNCDISLCLQTMHATKKNLLNGKPLEIHPYSNQMI